MLKALCKKLAFSIYGVKEMALHLKLLLMVVLVLKNIPKMVAEGADILVGGSSGLFIKNVPLEESIKKLKKLIGEDAYHAAYLGY